MRPTSCRVYPFLLGYELGKFIISPSLECPGCISEPEIDEKIIHNIFENYNFIGTVNTLRRIYKIIMLDSNQEQHINLKWNDFKKDIQNFFNQKISFPFLTNFFSSIYGERLEIPAIGAFKMTEGFYIATKFTSHHIYCAKTKGNKISIRRFDDINEIEHIELKPKYLDIGMDDGATNLFRDYISLLCSRPFLSLASVLKFNQHDNKNAFQHLQGCFNGSLRTVEAGAALIAQRDNLTIIDRNSMREIISYAEGNTHSLFINPSNIRL
jgi:hypothetical protein